MNTLKTILWAIIIFNICITIVFMLLTIKNLSCSLRLTDKSFKITNRSSGGIESRLYSFKKILDKPVGVFRAFRGQSVHEKSNGGHGDRGNTSNDKRDD